MKTMREGNGKLSYIANRLYEQYSLDISASKVNEFIRIYNDFSAPISESVDYFMDHIDELYEFIMDRTDIKLF